MARTTSSWDNGSVTEKVESENKSWEKSRSRVPKSEVERNKPTTTTTRTHIHTAVSATIKRRIQVENANNNNNNKYAVKLQNYKKLSTKRNINFEFNETEWQQEEYKANTSSVTHGTPICLYVCIYVCESV